jgi:hypothetical protein
LVAAVVVVGIDLEVLEGIHMEKAEKVPVESLDLGQDTNQVVHHKAWEGSLQDLVDHHGPTLPEVVGRTEDIEDDVERGELLVLFDLAEDLVGRLAADVEELGQVESDENAIWFKVISNSPDINFKKVAV